MNTDVSSRSATKPHRSVTSRDGTAISYFTTGRGPPVIAVPGALFTADNYAAFADALGQTHTVHTIQRRGRGLSGPQGVDYGIIKECDDVAAVQEATGAALIFGHSYGGLIALEVARTSTAFSKVAVYEPGVSVEGSIALGWMDACKTKLAQAKPLDAFTKFAAATGPRQAQRTPVWLLKLLLPMFIRRADLMQMLDLLPASLLEHQVIGQLDNSYSDYQQVRADVLVMFGGKSGLDWVAQATNALAAVLPSVAVREFPKLDHFGPDKTGPLEVAEAVATAFSSMPGVPA